MTFFINLNDSVPFYAPQKPLEWEIKHPRASIESFGFIPTFLDEEDSRSAAEQFNERYAHGGGWSPFQEGNVNTVSTGAFRFLHNKSLKYPGDPPVPLLAEARLHGKETIRIYDFAWVAILQDNGDYAIMRMD